MIHINLKEPKVVWRGFRMTFASHLNPRVPDVIYDYVDIDNVFYGKRRFVIPCVICGADASGSMCFICRPCYEKREERDNAVHTSKK